MQPSSGADHADGAVKQFCTDVQWGELDYLLIDMPPGTGDVQMSLNQTITGAIVVSTPQNVALLDARRGVTMFEKLNARPGVIERWVATFAHPALRRTYLCSGGGARFADSIDAPLLVSP